MTFAKMPRGGKFCVRLISIFLIPSFVLTGVGFAAPTADLSKTPSKDTIVTNPDSIVIPREFGLVKTKYTGKDPRLVIHIQDAHCNYEAQGNIVKILENLHKNYDVKLVSVEGADGVIDTSWFKAFPDDEVRKEVADYFMKKGEITGPEFLSITTDYDIRLFGAETRSYYIDNLNAFTSSYPLKDQTEKYLNGIKSALNRLKTYIYSDDLRLMDAKSQDYESKKLQFNDYVKFLQVEAEKARINLRAYENFFKLVSVLVYEKKIDFTVTDKERSALIDSLSKSISKDALTELVNKSLEFKTGKISSADYYAYLKKLALDNEVDMVKDYPNLFNYIIYNSVYSRIENESLFKDIKKLETDIKEKLFTTDDQRTLEKLSRHIDILIGLVNIKLLNDDYEYFEKNKSEFESEVFFDFLKKKTIQYGLSYEVDGPSDAVAQALPKLEAFYSIAIKRDKALVDNTLGQMKKEKLQVAVLVTGGFHSEGMAKLLEKQGVSYMVVCPSITKDLPSPYIQILTNQKTPLADILVTPVHASENPEALDKSDALAPPLRAELATMAQADLDAFLKTVMNGKSLKASVEELKNDWYSISVNGLVIGRFQVVKGYIVHMRNGVGGVSSSVNIIVENMMAGLKDRLDELNIPAAEMARIRASIQDAIDQTLKDSIRAEADRRMAQRGAGSSERPGSKATAPTTEELNDKQYAAFQEIRKQSFAEGTYSIVKASELGIEGLGDFQFCVHYGLEARIDKYNREHPGINLPNDRVCATRGGEKFEHKLRQAHISGYRFSYLLQQGKAGLQVLQTIAIHEDAHIAISKKELVNNNRKYRGNEEGFVDFEVPGANTRQPLPDFGNITIRQLLAEIDKTRQANTGYRMEEALFVDTDYGTAARDEIVRLRKEGRYDELRKFVELVYARRNNIDRMRGVLTASEYKGYDVIIISSTTDGEAAHQQRVIERVFDGVKTGNGVLKNKVCVLSVVDKSEGGQVIGQIVTEEAAREAFKVWCKNNGLPEQDLYELFDSGKVKMATYHNGGKGERFSPASQSFNLSRADQPIIGTIRNARGEEIELNLLTLIVLSSAFMAETQAEAGPREDVWWANQGEFGSLMYASRSNFLLDKMSISMPVNPRTKDMFDYGMGIKRADSTGGVSTFEANKQATERDPNTGRFVRPDPATKPDDAAKKRAANGAALYDKMVQAAEAGNGFYDYGSYSMSREMRRAIFDYWINVKRIKEVLAANGGRSKVSIDIDPALVQILVPLVNGLQGAAMPQDLPGLSEINAAADRNAALEKAYQSIIKVMASPYREILEGKHNDPKVVQFVYDTIDFFLINRDGLFKDLTKVVGTAEFGPNSHWFAYKRLLDMANEKLFMLSDLTGYNLELEANGLSKPEEADLASRLRAEDTRRMRGIRNDAVAVFEVNGRRISLTAEQVKSGWEGEGVYIKGSVIQGGCVLLPGSRIVNSVVHNSHGKIIAEHSYVESSTAPVINATESIIVKAIDSKGIEAKKQIVADVYRPKIEDSRFSKGQTRMLAPIGYDPKPARKEDAARMSDAVRFGDNAYSFQDIREMECNRTDNDKIENRARAVVSIGMKLASAGIAGNSITGDKAMSVWINSYLAGDLKDISDVEAYAEVFAVDMADAQSALSVFDESTLKIIALAVNTFDAYGKANPIVSKKDVNSAKENIITWMTRPDLSKDYGAAIRELVELASKNTEVRKELFDSFYKIIKFGTGGRRGKVGIGPNRINPYMIALTAQGHTDYLLNKYKDAKNPAIWKKRGVVIGYDVRDFRKFFKPTMSTTGIPEYLEIMKRNCTGIMKDENGNPIGLVGDEATGARGFDSKMLSLTAAQVYAANGIHTYLFDEARSTPETSFVTRRIHGILGTAGTDDDARAVAGVVMSSSHNQPDNNGSKFYEEDGGQAPPYLAQQIVTAGNSVKNIGKFDASKMSDLITWISEGDLKKLDDAYIEHAKEQADKLRKTTDEASRNRSIVAFHAMNGTGDTTIAKVLKRDGYIAGLNLLTDVHDVHSYDFSTAYNSTPNPEVDQSFDAVIGIAVRYDLDWLKGRTASLTRRGFIINMKGMNASEKEKLRAKLLECQVALTTDPDADRVGVALKRIDELSNGDIRVRWVTANDNDEAGLILFRYVIDRWLERGEIKDNEVPFAVTTAVSNKLEEKIAKNVARRYGKDMKVLRHPVGFKYTGEAVTFINNKRYHDPAESVKHTGIIERIMSGTDIKKDQLGISESDLGRLKFILSFEEGEGGLIASTGAADKDSGVIGIAIATLAEEMLSEGRTVYDYLLDIYREFGYSKSCLEPIVLDGAEGNSMIARIQAYLKGNYYNLKQGPSAIPELTEIAGQKVDWKNSRYHLDDYPTKVETEQESLDMMELLLGDNGAITVKDGNGKDVKLVDVRILIRPSGTEPKSKIWCYVGSEPLPAGATIEDLRERVRLVDECYRKILDAAMVLSYKQTEASYAGYNIGKLSPVQQKELLMTDFNTALSTKLGVYFPMMEKARQYVVDIREGKISFADARKDIQAMTNKFSSTEKENLVKTSIGINLQNQWNNGVDEEDILMQARLLFGDERSSPNEMSKGEKVFAILGMVNNPDYAQNSEAVDFEARALFGDVEGEIFLLNVLAQKNSGAQLTDAVQTSSVEMTTGTNAMTEMPKPGRYAVSAANTRSVQEAVDSVFNIPAALPESERLKMFEFDVNRNLEAYSSLTNKEDFKRYLRLVAQRALDVEDIAVSKGLQIMAGQALAVMTLIDQKFPGVEKLRFTANPAEMVVAADKDRGPSYISKQSALDSGIGIAAKEGAEGLYWRGSEGISKLGGNILAQAIYSQDKFNAQKDRMVMYTMLHIGRYHTTVFLHDYLPGSIQHTSTGPGHMQDRARDIKYVVSGRGVQWDKTGARISAQKLAPGSWFTAGPFSVDSVENLGGLIFNDFSVDAITEMVAVSAHPEIPYHTFTVNGAEAFLQNVPYTVGFHFRTCTAADNGMSIRALYELGNPQRQYLEGPKERDSAEKPVAISAAEVERAAEVTSFRRSGFKASPVRVDLAWGAEDWRNSIHVDTKNPGKYISPISGSSMTILDIYKEASDIFGEEFVRSPFFTKILDTMSFPKIVYVGLKASADKAKLASLLKAEQENINRLLTLLNPKMTEAEFKKFASLYSAWSMLQAENDWELSGPEVGKLIGQMAGFIQQNRPSQDMFPTIMRVMANNRAAIVSNLNKIDLTKLAEGTSILCRTDTIHAIFGLSLQVHGPAGEKGTEKNEAWVITKRDGRIVLEEPQQVSNTTHSIADFFTPLEWKADQSKPGLRKTDIADKIDVSNPASVINNNVNFEATSTDDIVIPPVTTAESKGVKRLTMIDREDWPYFRSEAIRFTGAKATTRIPATPGTAMELSVFGAGVIIQVGGKTVSLDNEDTYVIPATNKEPVQAKAKGTGEVRIYSKPAAVPMVGENAAAADIIAAENVHIKYLHSNLRSSQMKALIKSLEVDDGVIINAFDTNVEETRGVVQLAQSLITQEAGNRVINIRGTGKALIDEIQKAISTHQGRVKAVVTTTPDNNTAAAAMQYGSVVNVQQLKDRKGHYVPVPGLQDLALRIAVANVLYKDKATSEYTKDGARYVFQALDRIALQPDNKPFTVSDVMELLKKGFFRILPRIAPVDLVAAREAYIAAQAALKSL